MVKSRFGSSSRLSVKAQAIFRFLSFASSTWITIPRLTSWSFFRRLSKPAPQTTTCSADLVRISAIIFIEILWSFVSLHSAFRIIDHDQSGMIDHEKLRRAVKLTYGSSDETIACMELGLGMKHFRRVDRDAHATKVLHIIDGEKMTEGHLKVADFTAFSGRYPQLIEPAFHLQRTLQARVVNKVFWDLHGPTLRRQLKKMQTNEDVVGGYSSKSAPPKHAALRAIYGFRRLLKVSPALNWCFSPTEQPDDLRTQLNAQLKINKFCAAFGCANWDDPTSTTEIEPWALQTDLLWFKNKKLTTKQELSKRLIIQEVIQCWRAPAVPFNVQGGCSQQSALEIATYDWWRALWEPSLEVPASRSASATLLACNVSISIPR